MSFHCCFRFYIFLDIIQEKKVGKVMEKKVEKKRTIVPPRNPNRRPTNIKFDRTHARMKYEDEKLIQSIKYGYWR